MAGPTDVFKRKPVSRSVVVLDLSRYTKVVRSLELGHKMGAVATEFINRQIQDLVRRAITEAGVEFKKCFVKWTGDGAILQFESVAKADEFATALHQLSYAEHNASAEHDLEWRSFRVGIFTGDVVLHKNDIAGTAVAYAQRLESRALTGQILIDPDSFEKLPPWRKDLYEPEEKLDTKEHDPILKGRRCTVVGCAPWDAELSEGPDRLHELEPDNASQQAGSEMKTVWYLQDRERNRNFIGRRAEIELIRKRLMSRGIAAVNEATEVQGFRRITALVGLGGIGKTETAVQYSFEFAREYEQIFFIHADDPGKIKRDYVRIAKLLGLRPWEKGLEGFVQVVLDWMNKNSRWLLIVDNVDRTEHVIPFLPRNAKGHVLVTSRLQNLDALAPGILSTVPLGLFSPQESRELLLVLTNRPARQKPSEEAALLKLISCMGGLPVALEQAATYIKQLPCTFADYWEEFNLRRTELFASQFARPARHEGIILLPEPDDDKTVIEDRDTAIATTWDINFRRVTLEAGRHRGPQSAAPDLLLASAFLSPDDIPMELLTAGARALGPIVSEALQGQNKLRVNEALNLLHQFSLIDIKIDTRTYRMHRLVQEVVRKCWMTKEQRIFWAKSVINLLGEATGVLRASLGNWPDSIKDQHFANFIAAVLMDEWKQEDFEFEEAATLLSQTGFLLTQADRHNEANRFLERAIEIREKLLGPDHLDLADTLSHFANNLAEWGQNRAALPYYERSLDIRVRQLDKNHTDVAQVHNDLGIAFFNLSRYHEAEEHYLEALRIWKKTNDQNLVGSAMFNLAMVCQDQPNQEEKAEEHYRSAHSKVTNPHMRAHVCRLYGNFLSRRGRDSEALALLREGRQIAKNRFGSESEKVLPHNDALEQLLKRLHLEKELREVQRESKRIRERSLG